MPNGNPVKKSRNIFKTSNKYQNKIILLVYFPSLLIFMSFVCIVCIGDPIISRAAIHTSFSGMERLINQFSALIILLMCLVLLLSLIMSFVISHNMVGGFERIIRELDDIIAGRSKKSIASRSSDDLIEDLLKRVNVLVEYYVRNKNEK